MAYFPNRFRTFLNQVQLRSVEAVFRALQTAGVRYLVAGGLAVNAHGHHRFTKDLDLVLDLVPSNVRSAISALKAEGYVPAVPVEADAFADAGTRDQWIKEKGLTVFQMWSDRHPQTPIDLFVSEPFDFNAEYSRALNKPLFGEVDVRFVARDTLIAMKRAAARPQDLADVAELEAMHDG